MNNIGVICEFNPFHNGHNFLLEKIKEEYPNCRTVAIMSGNFVQRGDVAVIDKFTRAKQALINGYDLVVELPVVYAVSSAEVFAKSGVKIAKALCCDTLAFGCESSIESLKIIADLHSTPSFNESIKSELKSGKSYPKALSDAVLKAVGDKKSIDSNLTSGSNNILAIEYLKALKSSGIAPFAVVRQSVDHDSLTTKENFASASAIRKILSEDFNKAFDFMPKSTAKSDFENIADIKNLENAILYKLRTMSKDDLKSLPDVSEGLENRIFEAVKSCTAVEELLACIKTKRYTHARLRRILIYALLCINKDLQQADVPYVRVLGFNTKGTEILSNSKKANHLPIITKVSKDIDELSEIGKKILETEVLGGDVWALSLEKPEKCGMDYYSEIVKI